MHLGGPQRGNGGQHGRTAPYVGTSAASPTTITAPSRGRPSRWDRAAPTTSGRSASATTNSTPPPPRRPGSYSTAAAAAPPTPPWAPVHSVTTQPSSVVLNSPWLPSPGRRQLPRNSGPPYVGVVRPFHGGPPIRSAAPAPAPAPPAPARSPAPVPILAPPQHHAPSTPPAPTRSLSKAPEPAAPSFAAQQLHALLKPSVTPVSSPPPRPSSLTSQTVSQSPAPSQVPPFVSASISSVPTKSLPDQVLSSTTSQNQEASPEIAQAANKQMDRAEPEGEGRQTGFAKTSPENMDTVEDSQTKTETEGKSLSTLNAEPPTRHANGSRGVFLFGVWIPYDDDEETTETKTSEQPQDKTAPKQMEEEPSSVKSSLDQSEKSVLRSSNQLETEPPKRMQAGSVEGDKKSADPTVREPQEKASTQQFLDGAGNVPSVSSSQSATEIQRISSSSQKELTKPEHQEEKVISSESETGDALSEAPTRMQSVTELQTKDNKPRSLNSPVISTQASPSSSSVLPPTPVTAPTKPIITSSEASSCTPKSEVTVMDDDEFQLLEDVEEDMDEEEDLSSEMDNKKRKAEQLSFDSSVKRTYIERESKHRKVTLSKTNEYDGTVGMTVLPYVPLALRKKDTSNEESYNSNKASDLPAHRIDSQQSSMDRKPKPKPKPTSRAPRSAFSKPPSTKVNLDSLKATSSHIEGLKGRMNSAGPKPELGLCIPQREPAAAEEKTLPSRSRQNYSSRALVEGDLRKSMQDNTGVEGRKSPGNDQPQQEEQVVQRVVIHLF